MKLGEPILKIMAKTYQPSTVVETQFMRYDLVFKTDDQGRPILLFIGHKDEKGKIKGDRFARRLKHGASGELIKDHWEHKGKAS